MMMAMTLALAVVLVKGQNPIPSKPDGYTYAKVTMTLEVIHNESASCLSYSITKETVRDTLRCHIANDGTLLRLSSITHSRL